VRRLPQGVGDHPRANREHWYAGKPDLIGLLPDGRRVLVDWKTSEKGVKDKDVIQQCAYARAEFYAPSSDVEIPLPHIDLALCVQLAPWGYRAIECDLSDKTFDIFLAAATLYKAKKYLDNIVGQPVDAPVAWVNPDHEGANA
jgi:hypothetical protein